MKPNQLVWDFPTRAFHWLLVLAFGGAYISGDSERYRDIHLALGYLFAGLIIFRLLWGFIGTRYARFREFAYGPKQVLTYLQSLLSPRPAHYIGHNPAGAWAIFILLVLGITIAVSGISLYWEIGGEEFAEELFEELHEIAANAMLGVVLIHIAGVIVSSVLHKENLPRSMVTGLKTAEASERIEHSYPVVGVILVLASISFVAGYLMTS
ncbi:MAG: cytochrome b/b6 domain-containing protein [Thiofilum sp.]|uniref:cytochrome b/b6 domain-containing protein n=1 Tax=Thiofilum sp. TaxID=2212733 RepID=UPI0025EF98F6|nr:cytochrome b/b6 domain-containing protein [Thiofilum sp.]MBK8453957.1 cytochrome b/b6 domain-containing protein [Thiofilum sp.]